MKLSYMRAKQNRKSQVQSLFEISANEETSDRKSQFHDLIERMKERNEENTHTNAATATVTKDTVSYRLH